ncbi:MAG TPA: hypothetical protein VFJ64_03410 [Solirubrobacterales bacterium]|nr:hypothetical protein [Solirubrobacterales bacterium]
MKGGILNARGIFGLAAALAVLLVATGCGSSDSSAVTVETGSLSKAEFIAKADAICKAARSEFLAKYQQFIAAHQSEFEHRQNEAAVLGEVLESVLGPNIEGQIEQIGKLGAPSSYAPQVEAFLEALQTRIDEAHGDPTGLTATATPFEKAEDAAKRAGMKGCSESFS